MSSALNFISRAFDYARGLYVFILIRISGGECVTIPRIGKNTYFKYPPHKGYKIGAQCNIGPSCYFDIPRGSHLKIGSRTKITGYSMISSAIEVAIGDDVLIAEFTSIRDAEHKIQKDVLIAKQGLIQAPIVIGNDVWIGRNCTILYGTHIMDGCVIGANSLVKKRVLEAYKVYAGSPLAAIKRRV